MLSANSNGYPHILTMLKFDCTIIDIGPTSADSQKTNGRRLNRKYIVISGLAWENNEISMATPTFSQIPDADIPRSTRQRCCPVNFLPDHLRMIPGIFNFKGSKTPFFYCSVAILHWSWRSISIRNGSISMILRQSSRHRRRPGLL